MNNREVAQIFERIGDMLAIRGDNIHRILAYRRAAESIADLSRDINAIHAAGELTDIPGIGSTLAEKIEETFEYPTEILDPLKHVTPGPKVDAGKVATLGPSLAVAIGLALRGFDQ